MRGVIDSGAVSEIPTHQIDSTVDYAALPGPGGRPSRMPAPDARFWTLRVVLSQRPWSTVAGVCMALAFLCNGLTPVIVGRAVDEALATADLARLGRWIAVLAAVFATAIAVNWVARFLLARSQQLVSHDLRMMVTDRIQDPRGFAGRDRTAGGLLSIASTDTQRVGDAVMMTVMPVAEIASVIYGASMMFAVHPGLGVAVLIGGPTLVVIALWAAGPLQRRATTRQRTLAQAAATATDVVQGLRILKGLGAVHTVRQRYREVSGTAYRATVHANAAEARLNAVTDATGALFVSGIGLAAGTLALQGRMSIGELITVVGLTQFLIMPMTMLGKNLASRWASAEASGRRIREVLDADFERPSDLDAHAAGELIAALPAGLTVVSGAAGGMGEQELIATLESLPRTRVILAPHNVDLFEGGVADNIHPRRDTALAAMDTACCTDIPGGPEKQVGEGGRSLSGGQRQRVALARAIAAEAEVLILRDPTTAVDSVTEQAIAVNIARHRAGRTTLVFTASPAWTAVAAHRVSTAELRTRLGRWSR